MEAEKHFTLGDLYKLYDECGLAAILNDGELVGFETEDKEKDAESA